MALGAEVSTRHLSCVETGKARPSRDLLARLAEALDLPASEQDQILLAGGFAPIGSVRSPSGADPATILAGLRSFLDAHLPAPAVLLDDHWDVVDANAAAARLLARLPAHVTEPPVNLIRVALHPEGFGQFVRERDRWAERLRRQVRARAERRHDPALWALAHEITQMAGLDEVDSLRGHGAPVDAVTLHLEAEELCFVTVASRVETADDIALAGLHLETMLPADPRTSAWLASEDAAARRAGRPPA